MVIASGLLFLFLPIFFLVFVTYFSFLRVLLLPLNLNVDLCPLHTSRSKNILNIYWYYQYTYIEVTHMRILLIISWFLLFFFSRCFPLSLFLRWIILYTFTPMYWLDSFFFAFLHKMRAIKSLISILLNKATTVNFFSHYPLLLFFFRLLPKLSSNPISVHRIVVQYTNTLSIPFIFLFWISSHICLLFR